MRYTLTVCKRPCFIVGTTKHATTLQKPLHTVWILKRSTAAVPQAHVEALGGTVVCWQERALSPYPL